MSSPRTLVITISPRARASYLALASLGRRAFASTAFVQSSSHYDRSDFSSHGYTGEYEPYQTTTGPLSKASATGVPHITPRDLKAHLDKFVVGQERAKKVLSTAVCNHYQRIRELRRQEDEQAEKEHRAQRRNMAHRHATEDEYPGQQSTTRALPVFPAELPPEPDPIEDSPLEVDKSNVLLLGPTGVGKTLMVKTLARKLGVPFSMSDCTSFTQAGYIGDDPDVCVQRLLVAANYDISAAQHGIIVLDEVDKIASAKVPHGKDVGGEGVQQALLKIIEGTTVQVHVKPEKGSGGPSKDTIGSPPNISNKGETFNVRTDQILFIHTGAFVGLHQIIQDRIHKGSMGFGASLRPFTTESGVHETTFKGDSSLFKKHLPFYVPPEPPKRHDPFAPQTAKPQHDFNLLDLVEPSDLQKFGMIPELVGRIPVSCALSSLDENALVRVLTEPRNNLVQQFEQTLRDYGIELQFTTGALREVAKSASSMGTGARGLRTIMDRLLLDTNYEAPGSETKYVLVTQEVAQLKCAPLRFPRGQRQRFKAVQMEEEEEYERELLRKEAPEHGTFEEYRTTQSVAAGAG